MLLGKRGTSKNAEDKCVVKRGSAMLRRKYLSTPATSAGEVPVKSGASPASKASFSCEKNYSERKGNKHKLEQKDRAKLRWHSLHFENLVMKITPDS